MSMLFDRRGVIVLLAQATAISLSQEEGGGLWVPRVVEDGVLVVG
jgi:hypothetical protein